MPKLVAHYLREFSLQAGGAESNLYRFVFCLCLPFISTTFAKARLIALAVAECTNSSDQIIKLLSKITGATVSFTELKTEYRVAYNGADDIPELPYDNSTGTDNPLVPYESTTNDVFLNVTLGDVPRSEFEAYLPLLIPFYIQYKLIYN